MADTEKKMKTGFLQNAKNRALLAIILVVVIIAAIALIVHWRSNVAANMASAGVSGAPDITSTPGAGNPSSAYVQAQTDANVSGEVAARKSATSFVPTITRPGFVGNPDEFGQTTSGNLTNSQCPINKVVLMYKPNPASCTPANLKLARDSGVTAEELLCQGCACPLIKAAGYTAGDLKQIGLSAKQLRECGFTLQELMTAGFDAGDLKGAGFSAADLKAAGFTAGELKAAGFSAADLKKAGYSDEQLSNAGFAATSPSGAVSDEVMQGTNPKSADCAVAKLKQERAAGMSATELRQKGCGLAALKAAGFTAGELKQAGYTAGQLKAAGYSAKDLKGAGFSAAQLKDAGFSAKELKDAGFSAADLKDAGFSAGALKDAGFTAGQLVSAGFNARQLRDAGYSAADLKKAGFSAADLKAAGFSPGQLVAAGYSPAELKAAGLTAAQLRAAGLTAAELKTAGFGAPDLKTAGYSKGNLLRSGFTPDESDADAVTLPSINANSPEAKLAAFEKQQQKDMNEQQRQDHIARLRALMSQQANGFLADWSNFSAQQMQMAPASATNASTPESRAVAAAEAKLNASENGPVIKAGSVLFAVIETSINSDENTPIMAQIVAGKLNGSKLLGTFTRVHKRLLINFSVLSDPHYPNSIPINAVAIDPDTARTALSGQVNNHYLLRYGTLFASSFLEGISQGIMNQGITSNCLISGFGCTVTQTPLNTTQQVMVGFGKVGQAYGQHMGENFNRAPTVRIAAGTGVGVLIMGDLTLPANPVTKTNTNDEDDE